MRKVSGENADQTLVTKITLQGFNFSANRYLGICDHKRYTTDSHPTNVYRELSDWSMHARKNDGSTTPHQTRCAWLRVLTVAASLCFVPQVVLQFLQTGLT